MSRYIVSKIRPCPVSLASPETCIFEILPTKLKSPVDGIERNLRRDRRVTRSKVDKESAMKTDGSQEGDTITLVKTLPQVTPKTKGQALKEMKMARKQPSERDTSQPLIDSLFDNITKTKNAIEATETPG